jgi:putative transposase
MDEKSKFIGVVKTKSMTVAEACRRFRISRKSAYKWLGRFDKQGIAGLADLSRRPKRCPWAMPKAMSTKLIGLRKRRPRWGPAKILAWLGTREPQLELPAPSTVGELFKREGLTLTRRRRRFPANATPTNLQTPLAPNDLWCVDFKGDFIVDHRRCYPLTAIDAFSRFLLGCHALESTSTEGARPVFERLFQEYGLPAAIRSDNGPPFASTGLAGLSKLAVW